MNLILEIVNSKKLNCRRAGQKLEVSTDFNILAE
jgi:hypothetical protein